MNPYLLINIKQSPKPAIPTNLDSTKALMRKLTHRSKVIYALEAAKMVLPIWEKYAFRNNYYYLAKEQKEAPRKAIEIVEKWLEGKTTANELRNAAAYANSTATYVMTVIANTAPSTAEAADYANATAAVAYAAHAAANTANAAIKHTTDYAAMAVANAAGSQQQFYSDWWNKCQPLIEKELQDKYDLLIKNINGDI